MALGTFTPPPSQTASSFDPRTNHGKPLIVVVREFRENFTTRKFPQPKDVVIVDVVDLLAGEIKLSVIWGGGAMVDRLKGSVAAEGAEPERLPVKIVKVSPASGGNDYYSIDPLEGKELDLAAAWDAKNPTLIDEKRAEKEAEERAKGNGNGPAASNGNGSEKPITGLGNGQAASPEEKPAEESSGGGMDDAALEAALAALG